MTAPCTQTIQFEKQSWRNCWRGCSCFLRCAREPSLSSRICLQKKGTITIPEAQDFCWWDFANIQEGNTIFWVTDVMGDSWLFVIFQSDWRKFEKQFEAKINPISKIAGHQVATSRHMAHQQPFQGKQIKTVTKPSPNFQTLGTKFSFRWIACEFLKILRHLAFCNSSIWVIIFVWHKQTRTGFSFDTFYTWRWSGPDRCILCFCRQTRKHRVLKFEQSKKPKHFLQKSNNTKWTNRSHTKDVQCPAGRKSAGCCGTPQTAFELFYIDWH